MNGSGRMDLFVAEVRFGIHERPAGTTSRAVIRLAFCTNNFQIGGTELNAVRWASVSVPSVSTHVVHFRRTVRYAPATSGSAPSSCTAVAEHVRSRAVHQGIRLARFLARARIDVFHPTISKHIFGVCGSRGRRSRRGRKPALVASQPAPDVADRKPVAPHRTPCAGEQSSVAAMSRRDEASRQPDRLHAQLSGRGCVPAVADARVSAWRARLGLPVATLVFGIVARLDGIKEPRHAAPRLRRVAPDMPGPPRLRGGGAATSSRRTWHGRCVLKSESISGYHHAPFQPPSPLDVSVLCSLSEGFPNSLLEPWLRRGRRATRVGASRTRCGTAKPVCWYPGIAGLRRRPAGRDRDRRRAQTLGPGPGACARGVSRKVGSSPA